jgi:DNA repair photolyase
LVQRDVDVLRDLGRVADVRVIFSVGSLDDRVWKQTEPGAPSPQSRLEAMQFLVENGISAGVAMAPLLPGISDSSESIDAVAAAAASHRAKFLEANLLFLNPGSMERFMPSLEKVYPRLVRAYASLYRKTHAPYGYRKSVMNVVAEARRKWGLPASPPWQTVQAPQRQLQLALTE